MDQAGDAVATLVFLLSYAPQPHDSPYQCPRRFRNPLNLHVKRLNVL
jgi:hypothetical protein